MPCKVPENERKIHFSKNDMNRTLNFMTTKSLQPFHKKKTKAKICILGRVLSLHKSSQRGLSENLTA